MTFSLQCILDHTHAESKARVSSVALNTVGTEALNGSWFSTLLRWWEGQSTSLQSNSAICNGNLSALISLLRSI